MLAVVVGLVMMPVLDAAWLVVMWCICCGYVGLFGVDFGSFFVGVVLLFLRVVYVIVV